MELARKLNNTDYVSKPAALYISDPEVSIPHNKTATLDRDSEKYRITESNVTKANDHDLEFRTVVQNIVNKEQHLKMSFRIIGADGITVKYSAEKEFTIPALTDSARSENAATISCCSSLGFNTSLIYSASGTGRFNMSAV